MPTRPLIVAALKDEIRILLSKMAIDCTVHLKPATLYQGKYCHRELDLLVTGVGAKRMERGLKQALAVRRPEILLCVGYAGGTSPVAGAGSLVLAEKVRNHQTGESFVPEESLLNQAKTLCDREKIHFTVGGLVTVDRIIHLPHEKADIGVTNRAMALDMEAFAVAWIATGETIPYLVAKAVLDPMEMPLPNLGDCVEESGEANPLKILENIFKNPKEMMKLPSMQYHAAQARGTINKFLHHWLEQP